jgi:hypothetical protein
MVLLATAAGATMKLANNHQARIKHSLLIFYFRKLCANFFFQIFCLREILVQYSEILANQVLCWAHMPTYVAKLAHMPTHVAKLGDHLDWSGTEYVESTQPESRKCGHPTVLMWRMTRTFALFQKCVKIKMVCGCSTTLDTPNQHWMKGIINLAVEDVSRAHSFCFGYS